MLQFFSRSIRQKKKLYDKGQSRIDKQLDLVSFIRSQILFKELVKLQMTSLERFFFYKSPRLILQKPSRKKSKADSSSSLSSDSNDILENQKVTEILINQKQVYLKKLLGRYK